MPNSTTDPSDRVRCKRAMSDYSGIIRFMAEPSSAQITGVALLCLGEGSNRCVVCQGLFAGKPAPTGFVSATKPESTEDPCGSWLASDGVSGSTRRNQQFPQSRSMLNHLSRQLQSLIIQIAIILARRRQLIQVQLDRKLPFLAPGFEQQGAQRIDQCAAAGKQQTTVTRFHPVDH